MVLTAGLQAGDADVSKEKQFSLVAIYTFVQFTWNYMKYVKNVD